jgi:hypothetical protein
MKFYILYIPFTDSNMQAAMLFWFEDGVRSGARARLADRVVGAEQMPKGHSSCGA